MPNEQAKVSALTVPKDPPPFTLGDLKRSIPAHCFERSYVISIYYLCRDLVLIGSLLYGGVLLLRNEANLHPAVSAGLWLAYWIAQGTVMTGLWVLAHECGHHAFSPSELFDDFVGLFAHSALLVPYFSWQMSHAKHHRSTGDMDNDEVFVPDLRSRYVKSDTKLPLTPFQAATGIVIMLSFGWLAYLTVNASGPAKNKGASHFTAGTVLLPQNMTLKVFITDLVLVAWVGFLVYLASVTSIKTVVFLYLIPYFIVNFWLTLITYLQHTDTYLPHYRGKQWNWLRGALATVDRDYGSLLNNILHNINDTHVCHHLFSYLPHYHAEEATRAMRPVLGKYYLRDETPVAKALWRSYNNCRFVDEDDEVVFYKAK
eukprot:TRINITY_DN307_c0_g1_i1.p1 TRINITY_DN307_c0_g1~~TRINITY_DN307_c0_g1_i1.p1  ORF type:complete len:372 (+),score=71.11 TRINITY_DN307_c0_g1_i1:61-1176(+)